jgi:hypothetical protein
MAYLAKIEFEYSYPKKTCLVPFPFVSLSQHLVEKTKFWDVSVCTQFWERERLTKKTSFFGKRGFFNQILGPKNEVGPKIWFFKPNFVPKKRSFLGNKRETKGTCFTLNFGKGSGNFVPKKREKKIKSLFFIQRRKYIFE